MALPNLVPAASATARRARWCLLEGDCLDLLRRLPSASVDALISDPPAGIAFMGQSWDGGKGGPAEWIAWLAERMREALRVLKPGAHGLVWALPRTSHRTAQALEAAGFEVRDRVAHIFGSGFPKSLNVGNGWGTALKPAVEDWWLVRRPTGGTVAANVLRHGTGGINIDGCRVKPTGGGTGRWPAHLVLSHGPECKPGRCADGCPAKMLDEQSGSSKSPPIGSLSASKDFGYAGGAFEYAHGNGHGDEGGASRYFTQFYTPKASRSEREAGCEELLRGEGKRANHHPTVKSLDLMQWLCRLITPPGGVVLDPFAGSGSTGLACAAEGFRFIGCELSPEYVEIAKARIRSANDATVNAR